jgi:hypothetical protein
MQALLWLRMLIVYKHPSLGEPKTAKYALVLNRGTMLSKGNNNKEAKKKQIDKNNRNFVNHKISELPVRVQSRSLHNNTILPIPVSPSSSLQRSRAHWG